MEQSEQGPSIAPAPSSNPEPAIVKAMEPRFKRELRRHFLSEHERIVGDTLAEISLGLGLWSVKIPKLETLSDLTGLDRSKVHSALKSLHEMRIVSIRPKEGVHLYTLNCNSDNWKVKPRIALATTLRGLETIQELNGLATAAQGEPENFNGGANIQLLLPSVADSATVAKETFPSLS